ncbi:hypothetical protein Tco_1522526 [Tanacetum coccineum]
MEDEFYNLVVKGNDLKTYIRRFQELAVLCPNMVPNAEKLMEVFINGLPRSIEGNVTASKPQTLEEAINIAQRLMDQIIKHDSVQEANDRKRKLEDKGNIINNNYQNNYNNNNRNNDHHQQQNKKQETLSRIRTSMDVVIACQVVDYCNNHDLSRVEIIPTNLWHAPWLSDQLEWNLWHAPWLSDQLEWNLWHAPWLSDQLEWNLWCVSDIWIGGSVPTQLLKWIGGNVPTQREQRELLNVDRIKYGNEPILAFPEGPDDFVVYYDARSKDLEAGLEKREGDCWVEIIPTDLWHAPWLSDQLEWNLWHAPWLSDQLEWNLWPKLMLGTYLPGVVRFDSDRSEWKYSRIPRENWLLRHKAEMVCHEKVVKMALYVSPSKVFLKELVGFTPLRRIGFRMELVQGATLIFAEGIVSFDVFRKARDDILNRPRSLRRSTNARRRLIVESLKKENDLREVFQQHGSRAKRKLLEEEGIKWVMSRSGIAKEVAYDSYIL